ncbi:hypothetical protein JCM17380_13070 [Desulfosporosinus burensis]
MSKKTAINRIDLGMTRIAGWNLFDEVSRQFEETTPREVKDLIKRGLVNGLKLNNGQIELDTDGFNMRNLKIKSAVGKFRTLYPADSMMNMYAVVRVIETDDGCKLYETISNKCDRKKITHERLNMMIEMGYYVAGVRLVEGKILICDGVTIQDKRSKGEQTNIQSFTEVPEVEQHLGGTNIDIEAVSSEADNRNFQAEQGLSDSAGKTDETVNEPVEKTNSLETIFDSLDHTKYSSESIVDSEEANKIPDSTEENKDEDPSPEHTNEKKKVSRKTKQK